MLFDATNTLRDFFIWGWTGPELATLNVTNITAANCGWSGVPRRGQARRDGSALRVPGETH